MVAVDYFTKWAKAEALATITEKNIRDFFQRAVVYRFGIPRVVVTDNGTQFANPTFGLFCEALGIDHRKTSVCYPSTNGQTEVTNRTLLQGIKKRLDDAKGLWA
ncbi:DDE-type integrase/transposase/recombinase, partial [Klebsiella pneumoniae]